MRLLSVHPPDTDNVMRPRKFKMKLKEWGYEKYLTKLDKKNMIAKAEQRSTEGKATVFYHNGVRVTNERVDNFKRRRVANEEPIPASTAGKITKIMHYHLKSPFCRGGVS